MLIVAVAGILLLAGVFGVLGIGGSIGHPSYRAGGVVTSSSGSLSGVMILVDPTTQPRVIFTNSAGDFQISGLSGGYHLLEFSLSGYETTNLTLFLSSFYLDPSGNLTDLNVGMIPGNSNISWSPGYSEFPDLETFLALMYSASVLAALGGLVVLWGAYSYYHRRSVPRLVVGGMSAVITPLLPFFLGIENVYVEVLPVAVIVATLASLFGLAVLILLSFTYRGVSADYR